MKKYIKTFVLIAALLALPLAGCGKKDTSEKAAPPQTEWRGDEWEGPMSVIPPEENPPAEEKPDIPATVIPRAEYIYIRTNGLNVRTGAGTSYPSLGQVEKAVLLHYDGVENGWYRTWYRGNTAYVSAGESYTSITSLDGGDARVEAVIGEGLKVLGVPYVYGATRLHDGKGNLLKGFSTAKFDCSSLMQYIFYEGAGIILDVNTRTQIKQGKKVDANDLRRGDLMFFTNASRQYNTGIERVGHVALYLGDNYILHTASDYAKIEQISSTRWGYFIEARRVL